MSDELICRDCDDPLQFFRETSRVSLPHGLSRVARTYYCRCCHKEHEYVTEEVRPSAPLTLRTAHPIRAFAPFPTAG